MNQNEDVVLGRLILINCIAHLLVPMRLQSSQRAL